MTGADGCSKAWGIYIDNLMQDEVVHEDGGPALEGTISPEMHRADLRYAAWQSPGSPAKALNRVADTTMLGSRYSGRLGRIDTPEGYLPGSSGLPCGWLARSRSTKSGFKSCAAAGFASFYLVEPPWCLLLVFGAGCRGHLYAVGSLMTSSSSFYQLAFSRP